MTNIYIVVKCGYEGVESILRGFTNPKEAVALINKERARFDNPSKDDIKVSYYFYLLENKDITHDRNPAQDYLEREKRSYCIQRDSGDGFKCACKELGVSLGDGVWLY